MRGTSGTPRHTKRSRYRCSLPGLAGFTGNRCTEPEVPRIGREFLPQGQFSTALEDVKATSFECPQTSSCAHATTSGNQPKDQPTGETAYDKPFTTAIS